MPTQNDILLHGFPSSGKSSKAAYFQQKFAVLPEVGFHAFDFNPTPRDFEYLSVTGMIHRLRQYILDHELQNPLLIGSSMGALVALHYTAWFGGVARLLLLAPALVYMMFDENERRAWERDGMIEVEHFGFERTLPLRYDMQIDGERYQAPIPPPAPCLIIHGRQDDVVPFALSQEYAVTHPEQVELVPVDSGHRLNEHLDLIWEYVNSFLLAS